MALERVSHDSQVVLLAEKDLPLPHLTITDAVTP